MRRTSSRFCMCLFVVIKHPDKSGSAELDLTVSLLIQIDKLVMLIESPVFTSKSVFDGRGGLLKPDAPRPSLTAS